MKISKADFAYMEQIIGNLDTADLRVRYLTGDFPNADKVQDLDRRYRWDLFWAFSAQHYKAQDMLGQPRRYVFADNDYADAHIDTALRKIVPPLRKEASK